MKTRNHEFADHETVKLMRTRYHEVANLLASVNLEAMEALNEHRSDEEIIFELGRDNKGLLDQELLLTAGLMAMDPFPKEAISDATNRYFLTTGQAKSGSAKW